MVGHGIAGATLAYVLRERGHRVLVYDPGQDNSASNVAAGLMNPVAGKRFALSWRAAELLPFAAAFYRELEQRYGQPFFTEAPIFKLFGSLEEQNAMLARSADHPWGDFVAGFATTDPGLPGVHAPFGGAWLQHGGHVAVRELLAALAAEGTRDGWLRRETFDWSRWPSTPDRRHLRRAGAGRATSSAARARRPCATRTLAGCPSRPTRARCWTWNAPA